jgi:hypothetical protein
MSARPPDVVARAFGPRPGTLVAVALFGSEPQRSVPVAYAASLMDAFRCAVVSSDTARHGERVRTARSCVAGALEQAAASP